MADQQELEVEGSESRRAGFVEVVGVDFHLGLREAFVKILPEDHSVRCNRLEALPMEMVGEFACELVQLVEVPVEVVAAVVSADEATVS